jgi:transcriptional regulator GlxA family with amidase domain
MVASGGLKVIPNCTLDDCPPLDILVVPGGLGVRNEMDNARLLDWIAETGREVETLTSVCTGSMLLAKAGLLYERRATTHWQALERLRRVFPEVTVVDDQHVVDDGHLLTAAGISAGIDLALRVVARDHGEEIARATARYMEYRYPDTNTRRVETRAGTRARSGHWWRRWSRPSQ